MGGKKQRICGNEQYIRSNPWLRTELVELI